MINYLKGNLKAAKDHLMLSYGQSPTAKTRYYLDKILKKEIEGAGAAPGAPDIRLNFESLEFRTRDNPVRISGVVEDKQYVARVSIQGRNLFLEGASARVPFDQALDLSNGRHTIRVETENMAGGRASTNFVVHVDREGPVIVLNEVRPAPGSKPGRYVVVGTVCDGSDVASFSLNGRRIGLEPSTDVSFQETVDLPDRVLRMEALDRLGNGTRVRMRVDEVGGRASLLLASADPVMADALTADLAGAESPPPTIKLNEGGDKQTVYMDTFLFEGRVRDDGEVRLLTLNDESLLHRKGRMVFFSHLVRLKPGENPFVIRAADESGNTVEKRVTIVFKEPQALQLAERLSMSILPFDIKGAASDRGLSFYDRLIEALVNENRFQVVEREKLDLVLEEQKLSASKLVDKRTVLRLGKLVAARSILTGSLIETRTGVEIVGRLVDGETAEVLTVQDVYAESTDQESLALLAQGMAVKIHRQFPLIGGMVVQVKGKTVFIDIGGEDISLKRTLLLYREEPIKHPVSGKILGADNVILGRARVTQVMPEMSRAEIIHGAAAEIKAADRVITE